MTLLSRESLRRRGLGQSRHLPCEIPRTIHTTPHNWGSTSRRSQSQPGSGPHNRWPVLAEDSGLSPVVTQQITYVVTHGSLMFQHDWPVRHSLGLCPGLSFQGCLDRARPWKIKLPNPQSERQPCLLSRKMDSVSLGAEGRHTYTRYKMLGFPGLGLFLR